MHNKRTCNDVCTFLNCTCFLQDFRSAIAESCLSVSCRHAHRSRSALVTDLKTVNGYSKHYCSAELNYFFNDPSRSKQLNIIAIETKVDYLFLFVRMDGVRFIAAQLSHSREIWRNKVLKRHLAATMHLKV